MLARLVFLLLICTAAFTARANHAMGGEITWTCNGNSYVFELVFYRDCNGVEINTISETIRVWHHATVTTIPVAFVSRTDISPTCTPVTGSPSPLDCGTGSNGGNGPGAIERIIYRSNPIVLAGTPPTGTGWIFTFDNFSRSNTITNLVNPSNYGLTITAKMFAVPNGTAGVCMDNSPRFLQDPYLVSCAGEDYSYNLHPVDVDLDSLSIFFGAPLDHFPTGVYDPPTNPAPVPYEAGFSATSPTPDASFQAGNVAAQLNGQSGELTFHSNTTGNFVVKVIAQSFRQGVLVAQVEREMQLVLLNCAPTNNAPVITPPFAGVFETTVDAGTLVTFNLQATDVEVLQDGTPQTNTLTTTGLMYGTNYTSNTGCAIAPCATLNAPPPITGVQGANTQFSWQTDCAHLVSAYGDVGAIVPYHFVFKVQDNYCQVPKTTYRTVTINVRNPGIVPATQINCITTAPNGDVTVSWDAANDPDGTFVRYELHTVQGGLIGNFPIGTTSATVPAPGAALGFFVSIISGCNGNTTTISDTVRNVYLNLINANDGKAVLQWNTPANTPLPGMNPTATILREYPTGTWTTVGTVPYATTTFIDTIDICQAFLNYQVVYSTPTCVFNSNIRGDNFEDKITPTIPVMTSISVDTITGNILITWNVNNQPDTYGYILYQQDVNGFLVEVDTIWGINNNTYTHTFPITGPLTYTVSAFDSCFTTAIPPTYQTSAKAPAHTSVFLEHDLNVCNNTVALSWTAYDGWGANLAGYDIYYQQNSGAWVYHSSTTTTDATVQLTPLSQYCFVVKAKRDNGVEAFSNVDCFVVTGPTPPTVHYLRVATVESNAVVLRHEVTTGSNVASIRLEKFNTRNGQFEQLVVLPATSSTLTYTDTDVDVSAFSYRYRAVVVDSCGNLGAISNEANTILLEVSTDQTSLVNYLHWSPYSLFDGTVLQYHVYRGIDGNFDPTPLVSVTNDHRFYEDDVSSFGNFTGQFCYRIVAQEGTNNQYGFSEYSNSNDVCAVVEPLVYIPNAFTPGGLNPVFKPVLSFTDVHSYEMTILDRWGQRVFVTSDIAEGWNGEHQLTGKVVPLGVYVYVVKILDGNDQELIYRGHVTALRSSTE